MRCSVFMMQRYTQAEKVLTWYTATEKLTKLA